jgi:hypothetical protein
MSAAPIRDLLSGDAVGIWDGSTRSRSIDRHGQMPLSPFAVQSTTMQAYQDHVTRIRHQPWANGDDDWV